MTSPPRKRDLTGEQFLAALNRGIADGAPARRALAERDGRPPSEVEPGPRAPSAKTVTWGSIDEFLARHGSEDCP